MTQWVFRTVPCKCAEPEIDTSKQAAPVPAQGIDLEALYADDQPGVDVDAGRFPLDRYIPLELLGTGQEGDVYKATDKLLRRRVCVKLLKTQKLSPEQVMRFQREAQTGSKLKHPNLAITLDFGMTEQEQPYLVLEFCGGVALNKLIEEDALELHVKLMLMVQIAEGMQHAHTRGVLHRDLKTSNIIVLKHNEEQPVAKVVDFGLSVFADTVSGGEKDRSDTASGGDADRFDTASGSTPSDTAGGVNRLTQSGSLIGTPAYMSPEHASGAAIDERADIYALGCIMFETLTGRVPFQANSIVEVIQMQRESEVPSFNQIIPDHDLPEQLEPIVRKALAKDPSRRIQTMGELHQQLRNLLVEEFDINPASVKMMDEGELLKGVLPAKILESARTQEDARKAAFNRRVLITLTALGSFAALFFVCNRLLIGESTASFRISPPDITSPIGAGANLTSIQVGTTDEQSIVSGRLDRFEKDTLKTNKYADELAQKAYGIEAETSGKELFADDSNAQKGQEQVLLSLANSQLNKVEFARAARHLNLESLDLSGASGITSAGLQELKKLERLRTLRMDRVKMGAEELKVVAELPLEKLYISNSQLTDAACPILAKSKSLKWLDISENPISNEGIKEFEASQKLNHLRILGTKATARARVNLRASGWADSGDGWFLRGVAIPTEMPKIRVPLESDGSF
jgi:Serine/threonine protein kinase